MSLKILVTLCFTSESMVMIISRVMRSVGMREGVRRRYF